MGNLASYPKILALGNKAIADIFDDPVQITEKVDGSMFAFGRIDGAPAMRSKGVGDIIGRPNGMFDAAMDTANRIIPMLDHENIGIYAEYLRTPRHNVLEYGRVPKGNLAIWGIYLDGEWLDYEVMAFWAQELGLDVVPLIYEGIATPAMVKEFIDRESFLGKAKIEGVVVKNFHKTFWWREMAHQVMPGKFVSEAFKEVHKSSWTGAREKGRLQKFLESFATEARWEKAIQRRREAGEFEGDPRDIGPLIHSIHNDITEEEEEAIKDFLFTYHLKDIKRHAVMGFPQWFKEKLMEGQFNA